MVSSFALYKAIQYSPNNGWFILFVACFLICALTGVVQAQPDWYKKPPHDDRYYYGVGMSTENMDRAEDKAYANLAQGILSKIEVQQVSRVISTGVGKYEIIRQDYSDLTRITAKQTLPGVHIKNRDPQGNKHYALARLSREKYRQYIEKQWDKVRKIVSYGDSSKTTRDVVSALQEYSKALNVARTLPFRDQKTSLSDIGIERKITHIKNDLEIKAVSGNEQVGMYGGSLVKALVVQVHYQGSPFASFPLWATYRRGTGQLKNSSGQTGRSVRVPTDANGQAIFWVEDIKSLSRVNRIRVNAKELSISTGVDFHYNSLFPTRHSAQGPVIYFNGSADEQSFEEGTKVKVEVHVPQKCYLNLFEIFADGRLKHLQSVPIQSKEYSGDKLLRVRHEQSNWILEYVNASSLNAKRGPGLETLLVITTQNEWIPTEGTRAKEWLSRRFGETLTPKKLTFQLNKDVASDEWQVGWTSYVVEKNE